MQNGKMKVYREGNTIKRPAIFPTALATVLCPGSTPLLAQHGGLGSHGPAASRDSGAEGSKSEAESGAQTSGGMTVFQHAQHNTKLVSRLESPRGITGTVNRLSHLQQLEGDAAGFKNLGQFVAAVHVSHNLEIPLDQLRARVVGPPAQLWVRPSSFSNPKPTARRKPEKPASKPTMTSKRAIRNLSALLDPAPREGRWSPAFAPPS